MLTRADPNMFKLGDAVLVLYPKEDTKYHGAYSAFYVKSYSGGKQCLVLWADGKFKHTTTVVHRRYIKSDDSRSAMEESNLRQHVYTRDRITQTLSSDSSTSESEKEVDDPDSTGESEKYTPSKRPKRQAFNRARRKIRKTVNKLTNNILKKRRVKEKAEKSGVDVEGKSIVEERNRKSLEFEVNKKYNQEIKASVCEICGGETVESSVDCNNLLLCDYDGCGGTGGEDKNADYCTKAMHIYCMVRPLPENFDMAVSKWLCPLHRPKSADEKILHVKYTQNTFGDSSYLKLKDGEGWTKCSDTDYVKYAISNKRALTTKSQCGIPVEIATDSIEDKRLSLNYLRSYNYTTPTSLGSDDGIPPIIRKRYQYLKSGMDYGITQFENFFASRYLRNLEANILNLFETMVSERSKSDKESLSYLPQTLDLSKHCKRKKVFLGYRYSYGQYGNDKLYDDVDSIRKYPFMHNLLCRVRDMYLSLHPDTDFNPNQIVINQYEKKGAKLGCHVDSKFLFRRPIISLRLFSDATLFFGVRGLGIKTTSQTVRIPQKRGEITVMDGYAANNFNHGINRDSINEMSVSVLIREVTPTAIAEMNIRKLDTTKANSTTKNPRNPSPSKPRGSTDRRANSGKPTLKSRDTPFPPVVQVFGNVALV